MNLKRYIKLKKNIKLKRKSKIFYNLNKLKYFIKKHGIKYNYCILVSSKKRDFKNFLSNKLKEEKIIIPEFNEDNVNIDDNAPEIKQVCYAIKNIEICINSVNVILENPKFSNKKKQKMIENLNEKFINKIERSKYVFENNRKLEKIREKLKPFCENIGEKNLHLGVIIQNYWKNQFINDFNLMIKIKKELKDDV